MSHRNVRAVNLDYMLKPIAEAMQDVTVDDTVKQLGALPGDTAAVFVSVDTQPIIVTFDGTDPAAGNGHVYAAGATGTWSKELALAAKITRQGGSDGHLCASPLTV